MKLQIVFNYIEELTGKKKQGSMSFNNIVAGATHEGIKQFAKAITGLFASIQDYKIYTIKKEEVI